MRSENILRFSSSAQLKFSCFINSVEKLKMDVFSLKIFAEKYLVCNGLQRAGMTLNDKMHGYIQVKSKTGYESILSSILS